MMELEQFCKTHNFDYTQVQCLVSFIVNNISNNSVLREAFSKNPMLVIETGIREWHKLSMDYYNELLTDQNKQNELLESIYFQLKEI